MVNDTIQPISAEYIARAIDEAQRRNDQAILIEINTPGGLVSSTRDIIEKITSSSVPVIVYVTPTGGHAGSAGIFILESADIAAMSPGTAAGAAHPVTLIGPVQVKPDDEMNRKIENDTAALIRSVTSKRGRNVEAAESAVRESKSFTEQEALTAHLIDYVASSPEDLFRQMQGKSFKRFNGRIRLAGPRRPAVRCFRHDAQGTHPRRPHGPERRVPAARDRSARALRRIQPSRRGHPRHGGRGLHPGCGLRPESSAHALCRAGPDLGQLRPVRCRSQVRHRTESSPSAASRCSRWAACCWSIRPIPEMRVHLLTALAVSIPLGLITAFLMTIALKARRNKVVTGAQGLVGETGVAQTALSPQGKVFVHGELWDAIASSALPPGQLVVVRKIDGLILQVEPLGATPPPGSPSASDSLTAFG